MEFSWFSLYKRFSAIIQIIGKYIAFYHIRSIEKVIQMTKLLKKNGKQNDNVHSKQQMDDYFDQKSFEFRNFLKICFAASRRSKLYTDRAQCLITSCIVEFFSLNMRVHMHAYQAGQSSSFSNFLDFLLVHYTTRLCINLLNLEPL